MYIHEYVIDLSCLVFILQTYNPGDLSIQNYEGMSGFQDNNLEEPIGTDHVPVQSIINELQKLLETRGISTSPLFSLNFPTTSGCASSANTFKSMFCTKMLCLFCFFPDSLINVQDIFLLLLQSFNLSSQEVYNC